jgi:hypothetical protein
MINTTIARFVEEGISDIGHVSRMRDLFSAIFQNYKFEDKSFYEEGSNLYLVLDTVCYDFCDLLMTSPGEMQIISDRVYLFKDKRFFIPVYFLLPRELEFVVKVVGGARLDDAFADTKLYQTVPIKYCVSLKSRLNLLYGFLRFLAQRVLCLFSGKELTTLRAKFKIMLCNRFLTILYILELNYALDLDENAEFFREIARSVVMSY